MSPTTTNTDLVVGYKTWTPRLGAGTWIMAGTEPNTPNKHGQVGNTFLGTTDLWSLLGFDAHPPLGSGHRQIHVPCPVFLLVRLLRQEVGVFGVVAFALY